MYSYKHTHFRRIKNSCRKALSITPPPLKSCSLIMENTGIHNLSRHILTREETILLSLGTKFIPRPPDTSNTAILSDLDTFDRSVRTKHFFLNQPPSEDTSILRVKNTNWSPPLASPLVENYLLEVRSQILTQLAAKPTRNRLLPANLTKAIETLTADTSIIIKPCDKNLGIAILDLDWYKTEAFRQLNDPATYQQLPGPPSQSTLHDSLLSLLDQHYMLFPPQKPDKQTKVATYILQSFKRPLKLSTFYLLPKVHKTPVTGRPIVASIGSPTYLASKYLDSIFKPISQLFPSYTKNSFDIVKIFESQCFQHSDIFLTADVTNLYPSIIIADGLRCLRIALNRKNLPDCRIEFLISLTSWVLSNNYFTFDDTFWLQLRGTAMGTPVAVSFAVIYLGIFEEEVFAKCRSLYTDFLMPALYKRYIDDILALFAKLIDAQRFIEVFNNHSPSITATAEYSAHSAIFLDIIPFKGPRFFESLKLDTCLYEKPMNKHLFLPHASFHPPHVFKAFIRSNLCRFRINCSQDDDFLRAKDLYFARLLKRGYTETFLTPIFQPPLDRLRLLTARTHSTANKSEDSNPLVFKTTFTPRTRTLDLKKCFTYPEYLFQDPHSRIIFKHPPLVSYSLPKRLLSAPIISSKLRTTPVPK